MAVDVWRLQTRTDNKEKGKIAQTVLTDGEMYCIL